jgi:cytochrome c
MNRYRVWAVCLTLTAGFSTALMGAKGDAVKGKTVFSKCAICHSADTDEKKMGPGLKGLFKKEKMTDGKKPTDATVRAKIDDGSSNGMPPYKEMLNDQEKDDLIAYLHTL